MAEPSPKTESQDFVLSDVSEMTSKEMDKLAREMGILGKSTATRLIVADIYRIAPTEMPVLIEGESGTGKEVVSKAIHQFSRRSSKPFFIVNAGAIAEGILESELFGHERGAFTGAVSDRKGYFEAANGGTIFLDEIGEMPLETQVKLLRVLESGEFHRVGGSQFRKTDVRIIAATNRALETMVQRREFRKDLYYRLKGISIKLAPLRERKEDIVLLVQHFARNYKEKNHLEISGFTEEALREFENYPWPGNIRELKNVVESLIALNGRQLITAENIRKTLSRYKPVDDYDDNNQAGLHLPVPTFKSPAEAEMELVYNTLLYLKQDVTDIKRFLMTRFGNMDMKVANSFKPLPPRESDHIIEPELYNVEDLNDDDEIVPIEEVEKQMIVKALKRFSGKRNKAAKSLGVSERTLYRKIKQYNLKM